jgi:AMP-binding enzyme
MPRLPVDRSQGQTIVRVLWISPTQMAGCFRTNIIEPKSGLEAMLSHTVEIDTSERPSRLRFAPNFNAAVPFIDRHISEGRGAKIAIRTSEGTTTYTDLAANVNRCAAGLTRLGLHCGDRMLMVVKDCPAFFYLFWGAIKAGIVPVPLNTLLRSRIRRSCAPSSGPGTFFAAQFSAGCTTNISGFDLRQTQDGMLCWPMAKSCSRGRRNSCAPSGSS